MRKYKPFLCIFTIFAMTLILLSGCDTKTSNTKTSEPDESLDAALPSESALDPYAEFLYSDAIDDNGFWKGVKALDYVELFDYKSISIPGDVYEVTEDAIQYEIDNILDYYPSTTYIMDRAVVKGDTVNIDYVGSVDGVEFENGSTEGTGEDVIIGETAYIDDFLEQLIGHTPGEVVNVEVTFPSNYFEASLQSKDALFVTTINYIVGPDAELSDEFVATNLYSDYGWATVDDLMNGLQGLIQKNSIQQYLQQYFINEADILSVPDQMVEYQEKAMLEYYQGYAEYNGMELEEFLNMSEGFSSVDEFIEANYENNVDNAAYYLVAQAVAEDAGISVSNDDLENYFLEYFKTDDYSIYEEYYGLPYLKQMTLCQKVLDYIADSAILA